MHSCLVCVFLCYLKSETLFSQPVALWKVDFTSLLNFAVNVSSARNIFFQSSAIAISDTENYVLVLVVKKSSYLVIFWCCVSLLGDIFHTTTS